VIGVRKPNAAEAAPGLGPLVYFPFDLDPGFACDNAEPASSLAFAEDFGLLNTLAASDATLGEVCFLFVAMGSPECVPDWRNNPNTWLQIFPELPGRIGKNE
jgi:hypothetical protein